MSSSSGSSQPAYYPLGLPPGSVRAILTIMIAGLFWLLTLVPQPPDRPQVHIPLFLFALLPMVLLFFAAHGKSIRPPGESVASPLYLPRGIIRFLLVAGFVAALGYQWYLDPAALEQRLTPSADPNELGKWPTILLTLGIGFLAGHVARMGPWNRLPVYQNLVAWVALIAMLLLLVEMVIELVIKPGLIESFDPFYFECILTGVVAFYFGARS